MSCAHWHWKSVCVDELNGKPLPSSLGVIAVSLSEIGIVWIVWVCSHQADLCSYLAIESQCPDVECAKLPMSQLVTRTTSNF